MAGSAEEQGRVFAYKSELDAWWQELLSSPDNVVDLRTDPEDSPAELRMVLPQHQVQPVPKRRRGLFLSIAAIVGLALIVLSVLLIATGNSFHPKLPPRRVTLTVRPFKDLVADPAWQYVAEGLTEEMVTRLGQLHPQQMLVVRLTPWVCCRPAGAACERHRSRLRAGASITSAK